VLGVSSSGLIYAVIVGAWAAYLVPMWLRRQDELNEARPTERFSTAIRLLSGRAGMERRYAKTRNQRDATADGGTDSTQDPAQGTPREPAERPVDVRVHAMAVTEVDPDRPQEPRPHPAKPAMSKPAMSKGRAKLLARRRRTTIVLFLAFSAGAIAAAVGGVAYLWAPAAPGVLLSVYIAHLRRVERRRFEFTMDQRRAVEAARRLRERERPRQAAAEAAPQPTQERERPRPRPAAAAPSPRTADRRALVEQTDHAEWVDQQHAHSAPDDGWEPVPVPLPTYVTAPVAPRTPGGVDLSDPDTWSAARSGTSAAPERPRTSQPATPRRRDRDRTPLFDQYAHPGDPAASSDRPRAANE
jgi:hypothetical protein